MNERASVSPAPHELSDRPGADAIQARDAMIGVACRPEERAAAQEFFELFKTPWEYLQDEKSYNVVLSTIPDRPIGSAKLVLAFASSAADFDTKYGLTVDRARGTTLLECQQDKIPLYGNWAQVTGGKSVIATDSKSQCALIVAAKSTDAVIVRAGFDLFAEVQALLSNGQPAELAEYPTLELHIALVRDLILNSSLPLVEIPPIPNGHEFSACLTHDVDHPSVRLHGLDHTTAGFLYRATIGSIRNYLKGRTSFGNLVRNFWAAFTLPLVHLRLAADFWLKFDRYLEIERGLGSTFFIIPFRNRPGRGLPGKAPQKIRAANYGIEDISAHVRKFAAAGCEIGLHGIDAWADSKAGTEEMNQTKSVAGIQNLGVRMHWLYFDANSPSALEKAGFLYDSTVGYNETVGFRSGTLQAYKPLEVAHLLELPLHVMDTSLFYPSYLALSESQAKVVVDKIIDQAKRFGGTVTVNWHDRSITPERLWDRFYIRFIEDLKSNGAWFPTANQAVAWFRRRRNVTFAQVEFSDRSARIRLTSHTTASAGPALRLRLHKQRATFPEDQSAFKRSGPFSDSSFAGELDAKLEL